jgi:hypothetical protein
MCNVYVWVPTKGWKLVRRVRGEERAVALAQEFEPLEVTVSSPSRGRFYYGGKICTVDHDLQDRIDARLGR